MEKLSHLVLAHRRLVTAVIVALVAAGYASLAVLLPNVSERNEYPGLAAYEANEQIMKTFGTGGYERPFVPVIQLPAGVRMGQPGIDQAVRRAFDQVRQRTGSRVVSVADGDSRFVVDGGRTVFGLVFGPRVEQGGLPGSALGEGTDLDELIARAMRPHLPAGAELRVTGLDPLATGADAGGLNVPVKLAITVLAALVVLAWVFRSALAAVPLLIAVVAVPVALLGLLVVGTVLELHETTLMMAPLLGIGLAVDYALIVVTRWREERGRGAAGDEAVHRAMASAGRAVVFSGAVVAIGLLTMLVLPIPLLRSLGVGGMLVTAASAAATLVVLPLLLSAVGRRWDRRGPAQEVAAGKFWTRWATGVVRHRRPVALLSGGLLAGLSVIALGIDLDVPSSANLSSEGPARDGLVTLQEAGVPSGLLTSYDVYVPPGVDHTSIATQIAGVPGVHLVAAPDNPAWRRDGAALLTVVPVEEGGSDGGKATIRAVRDAVPAGVLVGGNVAQQLDYIEATYSRFPWMLGAISVITYLLLAKAFRSLLLPLKAVLMNLLSLGAVLGVLVICWQWGWGTEAVLGIQPDGSLGTFVPITVFAFLYGLSMDYEVFVLARMREEYDATGSTEQAIVRGLGRTGRLVTSAALILCFSFASMTTGGELDVAVFASGVALGILLDATLIRSLLVPATVAMLGRWNWWLPPWAARFADGGRRSG